MPGRFKYDVLILGSGLAGLYTALSLSSDTNVLLCSKDSLSLSNSSLAQGGVAAVLAEDDSFKLHAEDTIKAGGGVNDESAVNLLVEEGPACIKELVKMGVPFDREEDGTLRKTIEGGHSRKRVVHYKDSTGIAITNTLIKRLFELKNVEICENAVCTGLSHAGSGFFADFIVGKEQLTVAASFVVLATGGIGRVYKYTTNSKISTGDGIRFAYELGAQIKDLDYVQFHPTAFASKQGRERFLISEAVRGEGAHLLNVNGERFMQRYDERLELSPRDKVSHSIMMEYRRTGSDKFFLDISFKDGDFLRDRFPLIHGRCMQHGVDMTKVPIPIFPCQHYVMGGVAVDENSFTGIPRLYAVGECSNTGVHGKNRLASNSLPEALVYAKRAAKDISRGLNSPGFTSVYGVPQNTRGGTAPLPTGIRTQVREIMQKSHFVIRDPSAAEKGLKTIESLRSRLNSSIFQKTPDYCEAKSLLTIAQIILRGAINR